MPLLASAPANRLRCSTFIGIDFRCAWNARVRYKFPQPDRHTTPRLAPPPCSVHTHICYIINTRDRELLQLRNVRVDILRGRRAPQRGRDEATQASRHTNASAPARGRIAPAPANFACLHTRDYPSGRAHRCRDITMRYCGGRGGGHGPGRGSIVVDPTGHPSRGRGHDDGTRPGTPATRHRLCPNGQSRRRLQ
jgi:hypothetical protein